MVTIFVFIMAMVIAIFTPTVRPVLHASGVKWNPTIRAIGGVVGV
jgi:hypothetical protein